MKKFVFSRYALALFTITIIQSVFAQESKYGKDSVTCIQNISLYREYFKQKNYTDAYTGWSWIFVNCPASTENMYVDGPVMLKDFISKEKDPNRKKRLIDTLLLTYDQRIKYFGKEGFVLGRKADDLFFFYPDRAQEAYEMFKKSFAEQGDKAEARACAIYMQIAVKLYKEGKIKAEEALDVYATVSAPIEKRLAKDPNDQFYKPAQETVEALLVDGGLATCDAVVKMFEPKFKAEPENAELLKKITAMLSKADCANEKLFIEAATNLHKLEPSAKSASNLAKMQLSKNNYSEAIKLYKQAIDLETDNIEKAQYYYEMAIAQLKSGQYSSARSSAQTAASLRSGWGKPILLIGDAYAASSKDCGEDEFAQKAVYWIAVDKYQQAKAVDPSVANEANNKIATYSKYFPPKSEGFFRNITEGAEYKIGCWINESTKARFLQ